jgi:hypothetical protein
LASVAATAWLVSSALAAQAQSSAASIPNSVSLVQDACAAASYDLKEFAALLEIELRTLGVARVNRVADLSELQLPQAGLAILHMRCDPNDGHLIVELADLASHNQVQRELLLGDVESHARARALALAVALLVETSWSQLALAKSEPSFASPLPESIRAALRSRLRTRLQEPDRDRAADAERLPGWTKQPTPEAPKARTELALLGAARAFPARNTGLLGLDLVFVPILARTRIAFDLEGLWGSQEISDQAGEIANVHMFWFSGGLSALWASGSQPELSFGPYARLGYGLANVTAQRAGYITRSAGSFLTAVGVATWLRGKISPELSIWAGFDLGYVPNGVVFLADLSRTAGMAEVTIALHTGIGFAL